MWIDESVFYQIYPLGMTGAPLKNDGIQVNRIGMVSSFTEHFKKLGINAIYFCPVFESDKHGYDTTDYRKIDCRLGSNEDFAAVCKALKNAGIRIVLDGVFNHVGRGFWAFRDVLQNRENSRYKDWFYLKLDGNTCYNDGLYYEGWEGHYELVKLNLQNPEVVEHLFESIKMWVAEFDIDGLRLDVAYSLPNDFLHKLRAFTDSLKPDFALIGEVLFGDYNRLMGDDKLHSCTSYECYKGIYSSLNDMNMFEIAHSLERQFGSKPHCLYRGKHLMSFADNHDVSRIASILKNKEHIPLAYLLVFTIPGYPCIYYGSEWGILGDKADGDNALRPAIKEPIFNALSEFIALLAKLCKEYKSLVYGSYEHIFLTNRQLIFKRELEGEVLLVAINADAQDFEASLDVECDAYELIAGEDVHIDRKLLMKAYGTAVYVLK